MEELQARKLRRFNILLDDESLLYFAGSFLTGSVLLELTEDLTVKELLFHIVGESVVRLTSSKPKLSVADRETYIDFRLKLLGSKNNDTADQDEDSDENQSNESSQSGCDEQLLVLSPGVHTFPFKLRLPLELPSTFLGSLGWIQYFCKATLREPNGVEHSNQQVLVVINPIDLNCESKLLQQPFVCEARERVGSSCSPVGSVAASVQLDRRGFVPGESISIWASIQNDTRVPIKRTKVLLAETVEYSANGRVVECETRELASVETLIKIAPKSTGQVHKQLLPIPALPPTNIKGCSLIKVSHEVHFLIFLSHYSKKPIKVQLPIVMATFPVRNADGTLKRRKNAVYPNILPISRVQ